jgi:hypothetical protein
MRTIGENTSSKTFIVEMSREEHTAFRHLQRISEGRFNSTYLQGLDANMTPSIMAVITFVQAQDVIGALEAGLAKLREALQ